MMIQIEVQTLKSSNKKNGVKKNILLSNKKPFLKICKNIISEILKDIKVRIGVFLDP